MTMTMTTISQEDGDGSKSKISDLNWQRKLVLARVYKLMDNQEEEEPSDQIQSNIQKLISENKDILTQNDIKQLTFEDVVTNGRDGKSPGNDNDEKVG